MRPNGVQKTPYVRSILAKIAHALPTKSPAAFHIDRGAEARLPNDGFFASPDPFLNLLSR